jgi:protein TonB
MNWCPFEVSPSSTTGAQEKGSEMSIASAAAFQPDFDPELVPTVVSSGAQSLLYDERRNLSSIIVQSIAVVAYATVFVAVASLTLRSSDTVLEEPLELVMLPFEPEIPAVEDSPPAEEPIEDEPPPPALAEEPEPVAPVEPPQPIPERKPVRVKKKVAEKPVIPQASRPAAVTAPGPARVGQEPPNAVPSGYANQIHTRVSRTAATSSARAAIAHGQNARVPYRLVIGPNGELVSKSISPSGNPTFDTAAAEALSRAAPFPPTGMSRPISLTGAIVYR